MSKAEENRRLLKIKLLEARLKSYYGRVKGMLDLSSKTDPSNAKEVQVFLEETSQLSVVRTEFNSEFDELTLYQMESNEGSEPNLVALEAFESVYRMVQGKFDALAGKMNTNQSGPSKHAPKIRLPPIELPKFDGNTKAWPMFIECFANTIHNNSELTNSEKVYYLCGQLKGRALECIAGITPTGDNYELIYDTLIGKFQDVRSLGTAYLDEIINLKKMQSPSVDGLNSFIDKFSVSVSALEKLDIPAKLDFVFLYLALKRVDVETARLFENSVRAEKIPSYASFAKFVKEQAKIMERTGTPYTSGGGSRNTTTAAYKASVPVPGNPKPAVRATRAFVASIVECPLCKKSEHDNFSRCSEFSRLAVKERFNMVKQNNGCVLCLSFNHKPNACNIKGNCNTCNSKTHHTLLHFNNNVQTSTSLPVSSVNDSWSVHENTNDYSVYEVPLTDGHVPEVQNDSDAGVTLCSMQSASACDSVPGSTSSTILLATARVRVVDSSGNAHLVRCLIDSGSQNHFVTRKCCERLSLISQSLGSPISVNGFGGGSNPVSGETEVEFFSRFDRRHPYKIRPLIVDNITQRLPTSVIDKSMLTYLKGAPLADDTFDRPGEIEMLIGAQLFSRLILAGRIYGPPGRPDALQSKLGYIIMGEVPLVKPMKADKVSVFCAVTGPRLDEVVRSFWELEEVPSCAAARLSREEQECEKFYKDTTTRNTSGRYTVSLPFKVDPNNMGNSLPTAEKRFLALERKMSKSSQLRDAYDEVITDYLDNGYISPVSKNESNMDGYVIPHHGVIRSDKVTTKLRVVLDASAHTDKGVSLNQMLHAGPNLQGDIFRILLNFRLLPIAICADVKQMYLQIQMASPYCRYLRMLYRFDSSDELQLFEFQRLCFGLSVSPFLALRTVRQLCEDEGSNFPIAVDIVKRDLYMDDICSSEMTTTSATEAALQLIALFKAGGFDLMKWSSNSLDLLSQLPSTHLHPTVVKFDEESGQKILGVKWESRVDRFSFDIAACEEICTKRNILSAVARLWDVLGFAAPVILYAKLLIKELWQLKITWDEVPPQPVIDKWSKFRLELPLLSLMSIPRHVGVSNGCEVTLLGFSDASEKAYGAAIYLHVQSTTGTVVNLLCAKSRVAPLKSVTLARLELCGALLLSRLIRSVLNTYESRWKFGRVLAFTDSTVTLHWIHSSPHRWKTFVANRVAQIQENLNPKCFYHIAGKDNPSDCLSRGLTPAQLMEHPLWLRGPPWINQSPSLWPVQAFRSSTADIPEAKPAVVLVSVIPNLPLLYELAQRISSWPKLLRIVVYILRFIRKLKSRGTPNVEDLNHAEMEVVKSLQNVYFSEDINAISKTQVCSKPLQRLRPIFVDGVLRVGGRLEKANLTFDHKHPILLPRKDHIVNLIIDNTHRQSCHAGPHLLLSLLRQRFWILAGRNLVRSRVYLCNSCFRARPKPCTPPVMSSLPECRLQISKAFSTTGLDFCGPLNITLTRKRGIKSQKAYICVFICLTTRAVHVELVPDLSTDAFLNALKRLISRRGPVNTLMSDHGSNFIGARSYLDELYSFLRSENHIRQWEGELSNQRIRWQMIPPNAPHFGGGWESTVKSFKTHLFRVIGTQILTYEELLTVLCQIEAVLNSRPLGRALSPDPSEPVALTPAHFLYSTPLGSLPSAPVTELQEHLLSRYLLLDKIVQSYWRRWSLEYLHTLQAREKWLTDTKPIEKGTIVLIMQNNTAPLHWPLGVIQETYPGSDRRVRTVLVKTKSGTLVRPLVRLCPLPSQ